MAALTPDRWWTDAASLGQVLREAAAVQVPGDLHLRPWMRSLSEAAELQEVPQAPLFPDVPVRCDSFSQWWRRAVKGLQTADELLAQRHDLAG